METVKKKDPGDVFRLCWVDYASSGGIMTFTDDIATQWGDDWNDAPADCNAGEPYEDEKHHLRYLAWYDNYSGLDTSCIMQKESVEMIIKYNMILIMDYSGHEIRAGMTWNEVEAILKDAKAMYAELRYGEKL